MQEEIGFAGLGALGLPMARNLMESGYRLAVYNRTASKAEPLVAQGARLAATAADAVTAGGVVVSVLWDAEAVESLVRSEGFLDRLGKDGVHVGMGTGSPEAAKRIAALHAEHGSVYVEAPVFGRPEAVAARKLWIPFAGPGAAKERVRPLLMAMGAQGVFDFGEEIGAATVVKLVGNFLIISAGRSMMEGMAMADGMGVDVAALVRMLTETWCPSPVYRSVGQRIVEKTMAASQTTIPVKDLGLFEAAGREVEVLTPVAAVLKALMQEG